jgi:hypothetical protein
MRFPALYHLQTLIMNIGFIPIAVDVITTAIRAFVKLMAIMVTTSA